MKIVKGPLRMTFALIAALALAASGCGDGAEQEEIRVGILHSLSGTMAGSETSVKDATLLAVEEINAEGGLLGQKIVPIIADGRSDGDVFEKEAERLITKEKVSVIFGCRTSASRKQVKLVVERHHHLLFYPAQYEGLEDSPNIIYTGAAPNQQLTPAVSWALRNLGKRMFYVGSDYIFPRAAAEIVNMQLAARDGVMTGEEYLPLGSRDVDAVADKIVQTRPNVILNAVNGDTNVAFFEALSKRGVTSRDIPSLSLSIAENELRTMNITPLVGGFAAWNYFQSLNTPENAAFIRKIKARFGSDRAISDPMEAAYFGVRLWSQAVTDAGSPIPARVLAKVGNQTYLAPEGIVSVDATNHHTWKFLRIGKIRSDGQFEIVWESKKPIRPIVYPGFRTRSAWDSFTAHLYQSWGMKWANPKK